MKNIHHCHKAKRDYGCAILYILLLFCLVFMFDNDKFSGKNRD